MKFLKYGVRELSMYMYIQGVSVFHVHILTTYGGMKTTVYGNFILCKFKFCKKLQHFEFICEKTIFTIKSLKNTCFKRSKQDLSFAVAKVYKIIIFVPLISKILNDQLSIGMQPACSNDTRFL